MVHHVNNALKAHRLFQQGQGLHRPQRRDRHHRRVHRPHDARPPLFGRPAPGARGQGARGDPAGEPDARLDHLPELFPHVQEARRHDRHGVDRGRGIRQHLRSRRHRDPDQSAGHPPRRGRRGLPDGRGEVQGDRPARSATPTPRASRSWSAPPRSRNPSSWPSACARKASRTSRCSTPATTSRKPISSPRPACRAPSPSPPTWPAAAPTSSSAAMPTCASQRELADMPAGPERDAKEKAIRERRAAAEGQGARRRRPLCARHRTPRKPPHRQPAARPLRPPGRSRPLEILPVAAGRSDAHLRLRAHGRHAAEARPQGRRGDHPSLDQQGAGEGAEEGRGAQLRHPQEPAEIRRRA